MRVMRLIAMAAFVLAGGQAWAQQVDYDPSTGILSYVQPASLVGSKTPAVDGLNSITVFFSDGATHTGLNTLPSPLGGWSGASYYNDQDVWQANAFTGADGLAAGTYTLETLAKNLNASAFGLTDANGVNNGPGNTTNGTGVFGPAGSGIGGTYGSVYLGTWLGNEEYANVQILSTPEPASLVGIFGAGIVGLVGFAGRRLRKVAV